jgi:hypothetical protein
MSTQNDGLKVLTVEDIEDVLSFEMDKLPGEGIEKEMLSWHAVWRREALEHYVPLGWSFIQRSEGKIEGYVLAQPVLFLKGWTQTLWVEHIGAKTSELETTLFDVVYRWARDKHFQKVYFSDSLQFVNRDNLPIQKDGSLNSIATTKV